MINNDVCVNLLRTTFSGLDRDACTALSGTRRPFRPRSPGARLHFGYMMLYHLVNLKQKMSQLSMISSEEQR